jgi:hypothetical protein
MKGQTPLSASEIREQFDKARTDARNDLNQTGAGRILHYLSDTVAALQETGTDIKISVRANSHSNAYDMMYTVSGSGGGTIEAHGFLRFGENSYLWAIASKHNSQAVERFYISKNNVVDEGGRISTDNGQTSSRTVIPGTCYDFGEDPEALQKLQKQLIRICGSNEAILENDPSGVFNRDVPVTANLQKPQAKLKL